MLHSRATRKHLPGGLETGRKGQLRSELERREIISKSAKLSALASTHSSTSPAAGRGSCSSPSCRLSGGPHWEQITARIVSPMALT